MPGINDALQQIDNLKPGEKISYSRTAKNAHCDRTTLSRRHRGIQVDVNTKNIRQCKYYGECSEANDHVEQLSRDKRVYCCSRVLLFITYL
jgi:hypothetical protein